MRQVRGCFADLDNEPGNLKQAKFFQAKFKARAFAGVNVIGLTSLCFTLVMAVL